MGEKTCLYILFGTHTGLASLIYVSMLLSCDFHVSITSLFMLTKTRHLLICFYLMGQTHV